LSGLTIKGLEKQVRRGIPVNEEACERLLSKAEARRRQVIAEAEEEYRQVVEAVRVLRSFGAADRLAHGRLSSVVLAAIEQIEGPFSVRDVEARLREQAPEVAEKVSLASLSTTLRRLRGRRLHLTEPGNGTKPAIYQRI
jgi:hypothetical protein